MADDPINFGQIIGGIIDGMIHDPVIQSYIGIHYGITLTPALYKYVAENLSGDAGKALLELAGKEIAGKAISGEVTASVITTLLKNSIEDNAIRVSFYYFFELLKSFASSFGNILLIFQIFEMMIDSWDPCGFNQLLDQNTLDTIITQYDNAFIKALYYSNPDSNNDISTVFKYIDITQLAPKIPEEFTANMLFNFLNKEWDSSTKQVVPRKNGLFNQINCPGNMNCMDYYTIGEGLGGPWTLEYFSNLKNNAAGEPIQWNNGSTLPFNEDSFQKARDSLSLQFANQNTIVESWIAKYWIYIILIILLILTILLLIK